MRRSWTWWVDLLLPFALAGAGLLVFPAGIWLPAVALVAIGLFVAVLGGAAVVTFIAERATVRLQGPRRKRPPYLNEAFETARAMFVAACLAGWPLSLHWTGHPTGMVWDLSAAGLSPWLVVGGTLVGVVAMDAWLYWKHRILHSKLLFGFHKAHHTYRDPTAFAGFGWPRSRRCSPSGPSCCSASPGPCTGDPCTSPWSAGSSC